MCAVQHRGCWLSKHTKTTIMITLRNVGMSWQGRSNSEHNLLQRKTARNVATHLKACLIESLPQVLKVVPTCRLRSSCCLKRRSAAPWLMGSRFESPTRHRAVLWVLSRFVMFGINRQRGPMLHDLMDFPRRSKWKTCQLPSMRRSVGNYVTVLDTTWRLWLNCRAGTGMYEWQTTCCGDQAQEADRAVRVGSNGYERTQQDTIWREKTNKM